MNKIRLLVPNEVECRVQQVTSKGTALVLLYKDARVDMRILDETFGATNWQRHHSRDNANCTISVWCDEKKQWIEKEDTGTESQTEAAKGLASDSFKRAGFNWGIGRELYDAPTIFIKLNQDEITTNKSGKPATYAKFRVAEMGYNESSKEFSLLKIVDDKGRVRFYKEGNKQLAQNETVKTVAPTKIEDTKQAFNLCSGCGVEITSKVYEYSKQKYNKPLCMNCQKAQ